MAAGVKRLLLLVLLIGCVSAARADWPRFRGPAGNGIAAGNPPTEWSESRNIAWKTPIPYKGWSSPVICEGRIWLTTATVEGNDFYAICVDFETGEILHNEMLFHSDNPEPLGNPVNCYGSPTPVVEPSRVYIHFGSYGTACLDTNTYKTLWRRTDIECRHFRGPGSSLVIYENLLILTMDGVDVQYMIALDKRTGRTVWKTDRTADWDDLDADGKPFMEGDLRKAYSTPLLVKTSTGMQMLSAGAKAAYGYDPATGEELWKVAHKAYSAAAMPVYADDVAYIVTGFGRTELWAVATDGRGDVTDSHVKWVYKSAVPRTPSPLLLDGLLYMVSDNGILTCLDIKTAKRVYNERLKGDFAASPVFCNGRIYASNQQGATTVFKPGPEFKLIAENNLDSGLMASPAVEGDSLLLRTKTHLYRISEGGSAKAALQLIRDRHFQGGFTVLAPEHGKKVQAGILKVADSAEPTWQLAQWNSKFSIEDASPTVSPEQAVTYRNKSKSVTVAPPGASQAGLTLMVDSRREYDNKLRTKGQPWPHLLIEQPITDCPPVSELTALNFHIEAKLQYCRRLEPEGYTTNLHCAQVPFVLTVQNLNRQSPGYGDFLWFVVPIYDDRWPVPRPQIAEDTADPSAKLIYNPGAAAYTDQSLHDGQWVTIDADLLGQLKKALAAAWEKGYLKDSRDLSDYRISSTNLGWEVTGLNIASIQFRNLSLTAETGE